MLADTLLARIDTSLSLVLTREILRALLKDLDQDVLLKAALSVSILLSVASSVGLAGPDSILGGIMAMVRRICVLVCTQLALDSVRPSHARPGPYIIADMRLAGSRGVPLSVWPLVEPVFSSSIVVVLVSFLSRVMTGFPSRGDRILVPEVDRLLSSVKWMFADTVGAFFIDEGVRWNIAVLGVFVVGRVSYYADMGGAQAMQIWCSAIAMTWVNIIIGMVASDEVSPNNAAVDLVTALCLVICMHALRDAVQGVSSLQGYVEWHLSAVLLSTSRVHHVSFLDTALLSAGMMGGVKLIAPLAGPRGGSMVDIVYNVFALTMSNAVVQQSLAAVSNTNGTDNLASILSVIAVSKAGTHLLERARVAGL